MEAPSGNTGRISQDVQLEAHCDYLVLVARYRHPETLYSIVNACESFFQDRYQLFPGVNKHCGRRYDSYGLSVLGAMVTWDEPTPENPGRIRLSLPGALTSSLSAVDLWLFGRHFEESYADISDYRATRIDAALDDFGKRFITAPRIQSAIDSNLSWHLRYNKTIKSVDGGWTFQFGSDRRRVVFYEKTIESGGEIDSNRAEARFYDDQAQIAWQEFLNIPPEEIETLGDQYWALLVTGSIDFRYREEKNRERNEQLPWWRELIEAVGGFIRHRIPRKPRTIERTLAWMERQVVVTLAMLYSIWGQREFNSRMRQWLEQGKQRLTHFHHLRSEVGRAHNQWQPL